MNKDETFSLEHALEKIGENLKTCMQCGTCTASCPNAFAMDLTPRNLWQLVMDGDFDTVFGSKTFALCSSCYMCTLRCPRGLLLTDTMASLKQAGFKAGIPHLKSTYAFYESFLESVRRHGRVREMEFMTLYFWSMKNPLLPLKFARIGATLMSKGKVKVEIPSKSSQGSLESLFKRVKELEEIS